MDEFTSTGAPLTTAGFDAALQILGASPEALWSALNVETSGCGYLSDRRPKILFERHYFHRLTGGKYDASHPEVSNPSAGGYGAGGAHQYGRLAEALQLDRAAALQSASWGLGQIMGANYASAGFIDVEDMVKAFVSGEDAQLEGIARFVGGSPMKAALQKMDWAAYARLYNGPSYAENNYDTRLSAAFARFTMSGCPDLDVRAAQVCLTYLGYDTGGIDGIVGPKTTKALAAFQAKAGIAPADGSVNAATLEALRAA